MPLSITNWRAENSKEYDFAIQAAKTSQIKSWIERHLV